MLTHDFPPEPIGGEGIFAGEIAHRLHNRGLDLEVIAPDTRGAKAHDHLLPFGVQRIPVPMHNFVTRTLGFLVSSRALVKRYADDVIYAFRPVSGARVPVVGHFHVTRAGQARAALSTGHPLIALANRALVPLDCRFARRCSSVMVVADHLGQDLSHCTRSPIDLHTVASGVDSELFSPPTDRRPTGSHVLFVGRLDSLKRLPDLFTAVARCTPQHPRIRLSIVGRGPQQAHLERLASDLGIVDRVRFVGPVAHGELPHHYREADVLVLPSAYESFGMVMLEAMACGTPVLSSDACASLGQTMFRAGDHRDLASKLGVLLTNPEERERVAIAGLERSAACTWDHIADRVFTLLARSAHAVGPLRGDC
ncbi:MAG: glycosyltransferase family 4 protein [Gammaproteobacteria bacterium]